MNKLVSLLVCTLNREEELKKCIESLMAQTYRNIEIIIVDQSDEVNHQYDNIENIKYFHIKERGLSNARNFGLPFCIGDWIALIDDDAVYDLKYFETAMSFIETSPLDTVIVSGVGFDPMNNIYLIPSMKEKHYRKVNWWTIFKYCMSAGMVIRSDLVKSIGFDVDFGVGSGTIYGSGEESDIVIRALVQKQKVYFNPNMIFYHKADIDINPQKSFVYNCGKGALIKKHFLLTNKSLFLYLYITILLRSVVGCVLYILGQKQYKKSVYALKGKIHGFNTYRIKKDI